MKNWAAIMDPLRGKTSLSRVFWIYGVLGSIVVSALGLFIDSGNVFAARLYIVFGLLFSVYVTVATYQCAGNCKSKSLARLVRISAIITLVLLPVFAYLEFTGALDLALSNVGGEL
jgi:sorbitol-specific phosphotransferase system component IIC